MVAATLLVPESKMLLPLAALHQEVKLEGQKFSMLLKDTQELWPCGNRHSSGFKVIKELKSVTALLAGFDTSILYGYNFYNFSP